MKHASKQWLFYIQFQNFIQLVLSCSISALVVDVDARGPKMDVINWG